MPCVGLFRKREGELEGGFGVEGNGVRELNHDGCAFLLGGLMRQFLSVEGHLCLRDRFALGDGEGDGLEVEGAEFEVEGGFL